MQPLKGVTFKIMAVIFGIAMASIVKTVSGTIPAGEIVFFRSFFAAPIIVGWLFFRGDLKSGLKTDNPMGHIWRGLIGTAAMALYFAGLKFLPLPEATAIGYTAPILVVIFAAMFLGETVGIYRLSAVVIGLIGVAIILGPKLTMQTANENPTEMLGVMVALGGAVCASLVQIYLRKLTQTESTASIVFRFSLTASVLSLFTLYWGWVIPTPRELFLLVSAGIIGGGTQIFLTSSYRYADASLVAPFEYTSMLLAIAVGYMVFDELPSQSTVIGACVIIAAGVLIIYRERKLGIERTKQRKASSQQA